MFARYSTGEYRRTGTLTQPQVFSDVLNVIVQTHAWPSFSPDGSLLAFFRMTYPSAVMDQPVETELLMIDASGSGWVMASFNPAADRKSTRLNSSHVAISYAVFCWKKKKTRRRIR